MPKKKNTKDSPKEEEVKKVVVIEEVEEAPEEKEEIKEESSLPETVDEKEEVEEEEKPKIGKLLWIIIPTTLLVGALAGGIITYFSGLSTVKEEPTPSPVVTIEPAEEGDNKESEADSDLKREDLKIQVLNGSGVAGAAGKAKTFLENLGYKDVVAGNADKSDYQETEISILDEKKEYLELLEKDLADEYNLASQSATLPGSSTYDVVITLGKK